jgi:hypothetical protein
MENQEALQPVAIPAPTTGPQDGFSRPDWQEVEPFYGQVFEGFTETIEGAGKRTGIASPSVEPVTIIADPRRGLGALAMTYGRRPTP